MSEPLDEPVMESTLEFKQYTNGCLRIGTLYRMSHPVNSPWVPGAELTLTASQVNRLKRYWRIEHEDEPPS